MNVISGKHDSKRIIILTFNPDGLCKQDISLYICTRFNVQTTQISLHKGKYIILLYFICSYKNNINFFLLGITVNDNRRIKNIKTFIMVFTLKNIFVPLILYIIMQFV